MRGEKVWEAHQLLAKRVLGLLHPCCGSEEAIKAGDGTTIGDSAGLWLVTLSPSWCPGGERSARGSERLGDKREREHERLGVTATRLSQSEEKVRGRKCSLVRFSTGNGEISTRSESDLQVTRIRVIYT